MTHHTIPSYNIREIFIQPEYLYIQRKSPQPSKALLTAIEQLKRRSYIVITKPDKEIVVVVMDKTAYYLKRLLMTSTSSVQSQ